MSNFCLKQFRVWKLQRSITTQSYLESPPPPPRIYTLQTNLCLIKCQLRHGSRKGGAMTSFPGKLLDFNSLESPFPGLWVIQTEYWPVPGFYLGFIIWGRSSKWQEFPRGGACPPGKSSWNEYALSCNLVHSATQFWEILQWYFVLFFHSWSSSVTILHVPSHIVFLDKEYLLHEHWPYCIWMIFLI